MLRRAEKRVQNFPLGERHALKKKKSPGWGTRGRGGRAAETKIPHFERKLTRLERRKRKVKQRGFWAGISQVKALKETKG